MDITNFSQTYALAVAIAGLLTVLIFKLGNLPFGKVTRKVYEGHAYKEISVYRSGNGRTKKKRLTDIKILVPGTKFPDFMFFSHRYESLPHFLAKHKILVHDAEFTRLVRVETDSESALRTLNENEIIRKEIRDLIAPPSSSGFLWARITGSKKGLEIMLHIRATVSKKAAEEELQARMPQLFSMYKDLRSLAEIWHEKNQGIGRRVLQFAGGSVIFFCMMAVYQFLFPAFKPWRMLPPYSPLFLTGCGVGAVCWGALQIVMYAFARKSNYYGRILLWTLIPGAIIISFYATTTIFLFNFVLDKHPASKIETVVVGKYKKNSKSGYTYYVQFRQVNNPSAKEISFVVTAKQYAYADTNGNSAAYFWIKPGYFGFPWVTGMALMPRLSDCTVSPGTVK